MNATALQTHPNAYRRVLATNSTASAYTAKADTTTVPAASNGESSAGYIDLRAGAAGNMAPNNVLLKFFGVGSDNNTGNCRVYGVKEIVSGTTTSYTHVLLADYAFTLSAAVGVASGVVSASERYADTITRTTGVENVADQLVSPTGDVAGHVLVDCKGHTALLIELIVGTATSVNALYAGV